jgi:DUF917 family protein
VVVSVNSNLCDAQWRILDQLHGKNYACQYYIDREIDREIIRHAQNDHSDDRLLATFHTARGKKLPRGNLWSVGKKTASELKVGKILFFFISEMEGLRIHNQKI